MPIRSTSLSASTLSAMPAAEAARTWATGINLKSASARRLAVARTKAPTAGPPAVQRAFALYQTWQENDLGLVRLLRTNVGGRDVWAIHTSTDGDASFVELYSGRGALLASGVVDAEGAVAWDAVPGAVRDQVVRADIEPSVADFQRSAFEAQGSSSAGGTRIVVDEMRAASQALVGDELSTASVSGWERAALSRVLVESHGALTPSARAYALRLRGLYGHGGPKVLKDSVARPLQELIGVAPGSLLAQAEVKGRKDAPRIHAFVELTRTANGMLPTQLEPVTTAGALALLREAGVSDGDARAALVQLLVRSGGGLYAGKLTTHDAAAVGSPRRLAGVGLFWSSDDGKRVAAALVPQLQPPTPTSADAAVAGITGVDQAAAEVREVAPGRFDMLWMPPHGGTLTATLDLTDPTQPRVTAASAPPVLEVALRDALARHITAAQGHAVEVLGWVGRDNAQGPGFVVASKPVGGGPATLSTVRIALGGAATVTPRSLGTSAADAQLARDLALVLARAQAEGMGAMASAAPDALLEIALRTSWADPSALSTLDAASSPVGFDPTHERVQLLLARVWGDQAVVVTFAKDGSLRVESV